MLRRVHDELLRVHVGEEPVERLAVHLLAEVQPVGEVADVHVFQVRSVHVEKTFVPGIVKNIDHCSMSRRKFIM